MGLTKRKVSPNNVRTGLNMTGPLCGGGSTSEGLVVKVGVEVCLFARKIRKGREGPNYGAEQRRT